MGNYKKVRATVVLPESDLLKADKLGRELGMATRSEFFRLAIRKLNWELEQKKFLQELLDSADDPDLAREDEEIAREFACTLMDGLDPDEDWSDEAIRREQG